MARKYTDFVLVKLNAKNGIFRNESELKHTFVEALKKELNKSICNKYVVSEMLIPALNGALKSGRKPDIRVSNLVVEVEPPSSDLSKGREQLFNYVKELHEQLRGKQLFTGWWRTVSTLSSRSTVEKPLGRCSDSASSTWFMMAGYLSFYLDQPRGSFRGVRSIETRQRSVIKVCPGLIRDDRIGESGPVQFAL
ncbi:MAG: hypothetical protein QXS31_06060 [Desulfurococcaceae archaeon]